MSFPNAFMGNLIKAKIRFPLKTSGNDRYFRGCCVVTFDLYSEVSLNTDIPEYRLRRGDIGTVVEQLTSDAQGIMGYAIEFFNSIGETTAVVVVDELI